MKTLKKFFEDRKIKKQQAKFWNIREKFVDAFGVTAMDALIVSVHNSLSSAESTREVLTAKMTQYLEGAVS